MKTQPPKPKSKSILGKLPPAVARIVTAAILLPILIVSIIFPPLSLLFVLLTVAAMVVALFEFWLLARKQQIRADAAAGLLSAASLCTVFYFTEPRRLPDLLMIQFILILLTIGSLVAAMLRGAPFDRMITSAGVTVLSVMYIVLLGGHMIALRVGFAPQLSKHLLSFFFLVIMGADAAAYYGGRAFGKHKLAPSISPGKTWEGAVAGMLASLLLAAAAHYWFFPELPTKFALPLAAVMNVISVIGDLTESALKRSAGAKDTAKILPGHGGVLDRIDSLLFNAPVIYYFARSYFKF
ncbi:MAG TPA: phosphatidate cytidylyltransferase [Pyrinomonadaceae bacterium]|nr:phosphatidate cytidylyltransferase [Pyrinomonadaceae bacterium]